jgi:hypothetical protein
VRSPTPFVPPPLLPQQVVRISRQRKIVRRWRNSFFIHTSAFFFAPLLLKYQYWSYVWALGIVCATISGFTLFRKWAKEHRRFKLIVCEELLGKIFERKIPDHTFSPLRQLSRDWVRLSHFVEDENSDFGAADENLLYKVFSPGTIEIFSLNLVDIYCYNIKRFRGVFGTLTGKNQLRPRDLLVDFGDEVDTVDTYDVPKNSRVFIFDHRITDVDEKDPDYPLLKNIELLYDEVRKIVDVRILRVVAENRLVQISIWTRDVFFDIPTEIKIDSKEIYAYWRRYARVYILLAQFLQKNFVPAKEHSEIQWY